MWNRFDYRYWLHCPGQTGRREGMELELKRVGLDADMHVNAFYESDRFVRDNHPNTGKVIRRNPGFVSCTLGHYRALKNALALGHRNVLAMENDVRFLKDLGLAESLIKSAPKDETCVLMFDSMFPVKAETNRWIDDMRSRTENGWCRVDSMRSFACVGFVGEALRRFVTVIEDSLTTNPKTLRVIDQYLERGLLGNDCPIYISVPNVARQVTTQDSVSGAGHNEGNMNARGILRENYGD